MTTKQQLKEVLLELEQKVLSDDGHPLRKGQLSYAEEALAKLEKILDEANKKSKENLIQMIMRGGPSDQLIVQRVLSYGHNYKKKYRKEGRDD